MYGKLTWRSRRLHRENSRLSLQSLRLTCSRNHTRTAGIKPTCSNKADYLNLRVKLIRYSCTVELIETAPKANIVDYQFSIDGVPTAALRA